MGGRQLDYIMTGRQSKHSGQAVFGPLRQSGGSEQNNKVPDKNALTTTSESLNHALSDLASIFQLHLVTCLLNTYHIYIVI